MTPWQTKSPLKVDDEEDIARTNTAIEKIADMRLRKLGTVIAELGQIPLGRAGAHQFEEWVFYTVKYLFAKGLSNVEWHPNGGMVQQRDVVGTVNETRFWRRLSRDYDVRQFVIEAKNYEVVDATEFRQAWGYLKGPYSSTSSRTSMPKKCCRSPAAACACPRT